jgi:hypothetical protein
MQRRFTPKIIEGDQMESEARFHQVMRRFDDENARDPNLIIIDDAARPRELIYAHLSLDDSQKFLSIDACWLLAMARGVETFSRSEIN